MTKAIVLLWAAGWAMAAGAPFDEDGVRVEQRPERQETVYEVSKGSCQVRWTVFHSEVNKGVAQQRSTCADAGQQAELIGKILEAVSEKETEPPRTLDAGRLGSYPEAAARLAAAAKESPEWDAQRGRSRAGSTSAFVVQLANEKDIFAAWRAVFERYGREFKVASVEKVAVGRAIDAPFFPQLQARGVRAADRVPYDCAVWLSMAKK